MHKRAGPLSSAFRRACIDHVRGELGISERWACQLLRQHQSTQRRPPIGRADEAWLVADMIELAHRYGRYGFCRIAALLRKAGPTTGYCVWFNARFRSELLNSEVSTASEKRKPP